VSKDRSAYVDFQQRASEFGVGDLVYPFMSGNYENSGRVVAVYPAIGMVDVEWPHGSERYPVEELGRYEPKDLIPPKAEHDNVPGGAGTVSVPGGPKAASSLRVAQAFVKKSLYWAAKNRNYRATKAELDTGSYTCPKCKMGCLRPAAYKMRDGAREKLLGCPECMFLVKKCDIMGHPDYFDADAAGPAPQPFSGIRLARQRMMGGM
jgi:hypothetical protein